MTSTTENDLLSTTDATVWTDQFLQTLREAVKKNEGSKAYLDAGWLLSWFANAIETGASHARISLRVEIPEDLRREINRIVGEACGLVSVCWDPKPSGTFDSETAVKAVDDAINALTPFVDNRITGTGAADVQEARKVLDEYDKGVLRALDVFLESNEKDDLRQIMGPVAYEAWERLSQSL